MIYNLDWIEIDIASVTIDETATNEEREAIYLSLQGRKISIS